MTDGGAAGDDNITCIKRVGDGGGDTAGCGDGGGDGITRTGDGGGDGGRCRWC